MKELSLETFASGKLPVGWYSDATANRFDGKTWRAKPSTGVILPLPGDGWSGFRVEIEIEGATWIYCAWDGVLVQTLTLGTTRFPRHQALFGDHVLTQSVQPAPPGGSARRLLTFDFERETMSASCDGQELLRSEHPHVAAFVGGIHIALRGDCVVHQVRVLADEPKPFLTTPKPITEPWLEVMVDFVDDLIRAPFRAETFDALCAEFKSWGVKRVHWLHTGMKDEGLWDAVPFGIAKHAAETHRHVGEIFPTAVRAAHRHGLQIFGMMKPFDMGFGVSYGAPGRCPRIGGWVNWITHFATHNRQWEIARRPGTWGEAIHPVWTRIDFVKEDDRPAAIGPLDLSLWVSDDNTTYRPYRGPIQRRETVEAYPIYEHTPDGPRPGKGTRRARVLRLDGLELREKFVAVTVRGREQSFVNRLFDLAHVFGPGGEETHLTLGLVPRGGEFREPQPFDRFGLEFDHRPSTPSANGSGGYDVLREPWALDGAVSVLVGAGTSQTTETVALLGLARGKARGPLAVFSPAFPEVRQWWLGWIRDMLEAGADGIEIRTMHHGYELAWSEYGFEPPVRDEFLRRHGVDIWATSDLDRAAHARLRGEYYTQFIREAKALTRRYGKPLGLHVENCLGFAPEEGPPMHMHFDWQTWIEEGLPDSITGKSIWPGSKFARELLHRAHAKGIPVVYTPYTNNFWADYDGSNPRTGGERNVDALIEWGFWEGYDAFQFYEGACVVAATPEGGVKMLAPALRDIFHKHLKGHSHAKSS